VTTPLIHLSAIVKSYPAPQPLRIAELVVEPSDRIVLSGLDEGAAEMFVHLVTGAALPDEGVVSIAGRDTRAISTDTEWLRSLDQFGIVTRRAVLLETLSVAANLALPLTLSIEPMAADVRARVEQDAGDVGLRSDRLDGPVTALSELDRLRLHLARAAANTPRLILLEHPTAALDQKADFRAFGETLRTFSTARAFGWIAISNDEDFAKGTGGRSVTLDSVSGLIRAAPSGWRRFFRT